MVQQEEQTKSVSSGRMYGYARVSAKGQNLDRQLDALIAFGVDPAFIMKDKASGKDFNRPAYKQLMRRLKPGDTMVIASIDRLGRSYDEVLSEWRKITKIKQVAMVVLDMPLLDTREAKNGLTGTFIADLVLQLLSYVAQVERDNIKQRQAEGIASAKARGVRFGRPPARRPACYDETKSLYREGALTRKEAAARLGVCVSTFDRWMQEDSPIGEQSGKLDLLE